MTTPIPLLLLGAVGSRRRRSRWCLWALVLLPVGVVVLAMLSFALALGGGLDQCTASPGGGSGGRGPTPSRSAVADIPASRLRLYRQAGRAMNIDWTFLASVGAQECDHGNCAGDNGYGCAGPMQIAMRRGSPCSPGSGPTLWELYKTDGGRDGKLDVNDPADAIFTAAKVLRREKNAPPTGGSYAEYRQAACRYYGACADAVANYAEQVMRRAVQYGFRGAGSPRPTDATTAQSATNAPAVPPTSGGGSGCGERGGQPPVGGARTLGTARRLYRPRRLAPLPASVVAPGFGAMQCDERIVPDVVFLMRRFRVRVTACQSIHSLSGEHPLGAAIDVVPGPTGGWPAVERLARALGWRRACAANGTAPVCANPPFRFLGYSGYPGHGNPSTCVPCGGGPHLHVSWQTSASQGQSQSAARTSYFAPDWIDVLDRPDEGPGEESDG